MKQFRLPSIPAYHVGYLPFLAIAAGIFCQYSGLDIALSSVIYHLGGNHFFKDLPVLSDWLHTGARQLLIIGYVTLLGLIISPWRPRSFITKRRAATYILASGIACALSISVLKSVMPLPCPWDTTLFGGERQYIGIFSAFIDGSPAQCFPAGHASGGYALIAFFFLARGRKGTIAPDYAYLWLLPGLFAGLIMGVAQQFRGAHYLSHDLFAFALCWWVCQLTYSVFFASAVRVLRSEQTARTTTTL